MIDLPNPFPLISESAEVTALIGYNPVRFYPFGAAPQGVTYPYLTYRAASITPINSLDSGGAPADTSLMQVSIWCRPEAFAPTVHEIYSAVRACLETEYDIESVRDMGIDPDTGSFRIDLDVRMFVHR